MASTETQPLRSVDLRRFKVFLDEPADPERLSANFDDYAAALAEVVLESSPQFAIGIFGDWGSGKTTLMRAIEALVKKDEETIPVWFNAWRYEKEQHLIVPLLDTLAAELLAWGETHKDKLDQAREAAKGVAQATTALMAGLSLTVGWAPVKVALDGGRVFEAFRRKPAARATSFYFTSLKELEETLKTFVRKHKKRRIVVFIDDLDRCLPQSALEVLESMKLFFDLKGFVFVVGLDQGVIERSIEAKYQPTTPVLVLERERASDDAVASSTTPAGAAAMPSSGASGTGTVSGADYVKKIFQVPFTLPRISVDDLDAFFYELLANAPLEEEQRKHMRDQLAPHLEFLSGRRAVNPRELKRMMNAYTIQAKMLSAKMADRFEPAALVILLTIRFRTEWGRIYEALAADPEEFVGELETQLESANPRVLGEPIPPDFVRYVQGVGGRLLQGALEPYISSVESSHAGDPTIGDAVRTARGLRSSIAALAQAPADTSLESSIAGDVELLRSRTPSTSSPAGAQVRRLLSDLDIAVSELSGSAGQSRSDAIAKLQAIADRLLDNLRALRYETATGAAS